MDNNILSYKDSADSWQMKIQEALRLPFPFAWLLLASILFGIGVPIIVFYENDISTLLPPIMAYGKTTGVSIAIVLFPEFFGGKPEKFFKHPGKIENIPESGGFGYFSNFHIGVHKQ